jgi:hypothetical protein
MENNRIRMPKEDQKLSTDETDKMFGMSIIELATTMNWQIAMPSGGGPEDDGFVHGMIIGEEAYLDYVLKHLE